jgi:hypothetical protein
MLQALMPPPQGSVRLPRKKVRRVGTSQPTPASAHVAILRPWGHCRAKRAKGGTSEKTTQNLASRKYVTHKCLQAQRGLPQQIQD